MKTVTIRGIDPELDKAIKARAQQNNLSANQWIIQALKKVTGTGKEPVYKTYHDLDALAGGWTREETAEFRKHTKIFERIDEDIWK
ncbi:MAG: toxin-antitoxin system HicB family antitoxin [Nitrospiraceae bacterium]|nr:toxin-antitoxin system HicB family antitoxin [Nitrospiraceae bacterium]